MAKDAVAFIRALGLDKVDLLGFSMGAYWHRVPLLSVVTRADRSGDPTARLRCRTWPLNR
jgi:hypothetical protein